jgi:RimJ/RimL family protein N-acetyltransferase
MECIPVRTKSEVAELARMADEIWHEYWPERIGLAQTDYMVELFQSEQSLYRDITENGYCYWLLQDEGRVVGYTGARPEPDTGRLFISKIYLYASERGRGYASETLRFLECYSREHDLTVMYLTVNKGNELAIRAYEAKGFVTTDSVETDIGSGYIMDDYIMEKTVSQP